MTWLPGRMAGPSRTDISRRNCGSAIAWRCSILRSIFFSGVMKFIASTTASTVMAAVRTTVQPMRLRLQVLRLIDILGTEGAGTALCAPRIQRDVKPAPAPGARRGAGSEPVEHGDAEADLGGLVVVVEQALAVAAEQLHVPAQVAAEGEAPVELQCTVRAVAAAQRVTP